MEQKLEMLYGLCEIVTKRLEECWRALEGTEEMTVLDIDLVDKLTHTLKCIKTSIAMIEEEFDVVVKGDEMRSAVTVEDLYKVIVSKA